MTFGITIIAALAMSAATSSAQNTDDLQKQIEAIAEGDVHASLPKPIIPYTLNPGYVAVDKCLSTLKVNRISL